MSSLAAALPQHLNSSTSSSQSQTTPKPVRQGPSPNGSPQQHPSFGSPRSSSPRTVSASTIDLDALLRAHGGDARKALEAIVSDRNSLQAQNTQLWKLIEKQRAQCAHLAGDNERLRSERERANARLASAGLEPVNAKRIQTSSSVMGLDHKAGLEPPPMRRHNSDREGNPTIPSLQIPSAHSSSPSSPTETSASPSQSHPPTIPTISRPPILLPSPLVVQGPPLRRESRMAFPPEVTSFMSLADSPRKAHHSPEPPTNNNNTSPHSDYSSSPSEAGLGPHASSRPLAMTTQTVIEETEEEEHVSDEANTPEAHSMMKTPPPRKESLSPIHATFEAAAASRSLESQIQEQTTPRESEDIDTPRPSTESRPSTDVRSSAPPRPPTRMTPALLSHARLTIPSSTVYPNALGRDVLCFIVAVTIRPPNSQTITWNVAKLFSAFIELDTRIKARSGKSRKDWKSMVTTLPDGRAWKDFAPSKIDQRKTALESYLQTLLVAPLSDKSDLCTFLSTDRVQAKTNGARKDGYLTKKGKNFGGWKSRYFVLDGPVMEYFESRGGTHLGSITITNAQIGRQNRPSESEGGDYRHAFLILEQSKKGSTRHVLCAESDMERDSWIEVLVRHVEPEAAPHLAPIPVTTASSSSSTPTSGLTRRRSNSRKNSRDVVVTAAQPMSTMNGAEGKFAGAPSPSFINSMETKRATQSLVSDGGSASVTSHAMTPSGSSASQASTTHSIQESRPIVVPTHPMTMVTSPSPEILSSSPPTRETTRSAKRQSMMPNRGQQSHSAAYLTKVATDGLSVPPGMQERERDRKAKSGRFWPSFGKTAEKVTRPVFGVPLPESIAIASKANLPAIVFRCIEYLEAKEAEAEEGIYRLSGSSAVIKGLKERFDTEGDVDLVQLDEHWDPHAIAGLLKTFLRELPSSLLTRDLHPRFLAVMDLIDCSARVSELSRLVSELPPHNYALLRALTAHLILIVRNSTLNKMTLRNIGIVFSPTLGIPAGIFSELVSHFGAIFDDEDMETDVSKEGEQDSITALSRSDDAEETVRRKRNSMLYQAGGADVMLGLGGRSLDPSIEDSASEVDTDEPDSEALSASEENLSILNTTPRAEGYPSATAVRRMQAAARAAEHGLSVETPAIPDALRSPIHSPGLPVSPRPSVSASEQ